MPRKPRDPDCTCPSGPNPTSDHCVIHDEQYEDEDGPFDLSGIPVEDVPQFTKKDERFSNWTLVTLTFRTTFDFQGPKTMYYRTQYEVYKKFKRLGLFHAFPELTECGRLHWHILVKTTRYVELKHFRSFWFMKYGTSHTKPVRSTLQDFCNVFNYIRKDSREMLKILRKNKRKLRINKILLSNSSKIPKPEVKRKLQLDDLIPDLTIFVTQ